MDDSYGVLRKVAEEWKERAKEEGLYLNFNNFAIGPRQSLRACYKLD
jgi:hypothetical protein